MAKISLILCFMAMFLAGATATPAPAQTIAAKSVAEPREEAIAGEPFGVGYITIDLVPGELRSAQTKLVAVSEKNGRVYYPSIAIEPFSTVSWDVLSRPENVLDRERSLKVFFLFKGAEPLDLTVVTPIAGVRRLEPASNRKSRRAELLKRWWSQYKQNRNEAGGEEYPHLVDDYLVAMLARRLGLDAGSSGGPTQWVSDDVNHAVGLLTGAESVRAAMQKETMLGDGNLAGPATEELPKAVAPPKVEFPEPAADVQVEAIAGHVPHECFYIRFGSFENFQWFRSAVDRWGGDMRTIIAYRGLDYDIDTRIGQQLLLRDTALSKVFGSQVIGDVAILGHDTFLREGASIGIVFQAKNNAGLAAALNEQRREALKDQADASEANIQIAGRSVSFISTPDNRIRSYYAIDGDFHLVTTSRTLVNRFYEAGKGDRSLGASRKLRSARTRMPLNRGDTTFVYLSDEFFRLLTGPRYRIEMTRRLRSATDIDLVRMARLAAANEGHPSDNLEQLIQAGFLPKGFERRPDGSQLLAMGSGELRDSLRGASGTFAPVADVEISRATQAEVRAYEQFAAFYRSQWQRMDPVMVGIKRIDGAAKGDERIDFDIHITPVAQQHYGMLSGFLGRPVSKRLAPVDGDLVSLQVVPQSAWGRQLFGGLRNARIPFAMEADGAFPRVDHRAVQAYLGSDRNSSLLQMFGGQQSFDAEGFAEPEPKFWGGVWQRRNDQFHLLSMHRQVLVDVMPQLMYVESPREAQLRLHIGDLATSEMKDLINAYGYAQARQISNGNLRFLGTVSNQLGVKVKDSRRVAERLLAARLICPVGGDFKLESTSADYPTWSSTIPPSEKRPSVPSGFVAPPLRSFHGLELEFTLQQNELSVHAELNMHRDFD